MDKIIFDDADKVNIRERLSNIWGINQPYWYLLYSCHRDDVIAFDLNYVTISEKLKDVKMWLLEQGVSEMCEFRENGLDYEINDIKDYSFWDSDDYFWNNECYWFDYTMDWIIYLSHEQTITFGGDAMIKRLKIEWHDWSKHLKWDTKNKGC